MSDIIEVVSPSSPSTVEVLTVGTATVIEVVTQGPQGAPGQSGSIAAKDEGTVLTAGMTSINFVGSGVSATNAGSDITVTINTPTAASLGLGNVENKSSATIRGELTAGNVTTALTFTPLANTYVPAWSTVSGKPTTLAGYGITDALSSSYVPAWSSVTGKPTTLAGYGITDALASSYVPTWASITGKPTFATVATTGAYADLTGTPAAYSLPTASTSVLGGVKVDGTTITISAGVISAVGGGGGAAAVKDEGVTLTAGATSIDFVGAGVTATNVGSAVTITINPDSWASITSKPTTLAGFGITDALSSSYVPTWASVTGKPTTLAGYGITDALASSYVPTWASVTGKPTTISGYGITDALALGATAGTASAASGAAGSATTAAKSDHVHPHPTALQSGASIPGALQSVATGLTAAGTNQATALALTADINFVSTVAANTGVVIPGAAAGKTVIVINRGANALLVYPSTGHNFDTLAANASISVPVNGLLEVFGTSTTQWNSTLNAIVNASMLQGTVSGASGGTGVANSGKTITLGGNLTTSGAFASTFTMTAATTVTFPTTGTLATLAGAETFAAKTLTGESFTRVDKGTVASGTVTFDLSAGSVQRLQVGGALTITASNWAASGKRQYLTLVLVNGGSAAVTITPTINWVKPDGTFTTAIATYMTAIGRTGLQSAGTDHVVWWTDDAGTTIYGKVI